MIDIVLLNVKGRNIKDFIYKMYKLNISLLKIKNISSNEINIYIYKKDLPDILKSKEYDITIIKYIGVTRIKNILHKNRYMIVGLLIGVLIFILLLNIIYDIEILSSKNIDNLNTSLKMHGIKKYSIALSYDKLSKIKNEILTELKDEIEWLSIERVGTKYIVKAEARYNYIPLKDDKIYKIVAKKDALIRRIESSSGEVVGYVGRYVHKDDLLIDSNIKLFDEVKKVVSAKGKVYGETWYKLKIEYPLNYHEEYLTGKIKKTFCLKIFSNDYCLSNFKVKRREDKYILKNDILPISLVYQTQKELNVKEFKLDFETSLEYALEYARNKINTNLAEDEFIILEKRLKSEMKDSTIVLDIFYTIYEDITKYVEIEEPYDIQR